MAKAVQTEHEVAPNLIPMVDIMFLLLLFFMLGADMGHRELEQVDLPEASTVKEDKEEEVGDRVTVNVHHRTADEVKCAAYEAKPRQVCRDNTHWRIGMAGKDVTAKQELERRLKAAADRERDPSNPQRSERKIMIRADAAAPYGRVQEVLHMAAKVGMYKIECGAAQPQPQA
jgi:biopolymer transport protein ExbD